MLMNRVETALVNSWPRRWLQRYYEVPWLRRNGAVLPQGAHVLELGCGPGYGTQLILEHFGAGQVDAVDLDPEMITRAQRRLDRFGPRVRLAQGSATDLAATLEQDRFAAEDFVAALEERDLFVGERTRVHRGVGTYLALPNGRGDPPVQRC